MPRGDLINSLVGSWHAIWQHAYCCTARFIVCAQVSLVCLMPFRSSGLLHGRQVLSHEDVSLSLLIGAGSFGRVYTGACGVNAEHATADHDSYDRHGCMHARWLV